MGEEEKMRSVDAQELAQDSATLHRATILTSSLISLSHSINVFGTKWKSITNKLNELLCNLKAIENSESTDKDNFSSSIKLELIFCTLQNCDELAEKCSTLSYCGKLLMQSDLDILCAKLDSHIKILADIYSMGLLTQKYAIVLSKPGVSASRDDVRLYVEDLLSRLKIEGSIMKKQALIAFNEAIQEDERYAKVALELEGFVCLLVSSLDVRDGEIQEEAAKAVSFITGIHGSYKSALIRAGVISPLIRVLESGTCKESATKCLMKVTENSENAWLVSSHGGITALLDLIRNHDDNINVEPIQSACGVLKNLIGIEEIKRFMMEEGAVDLLVNLVRSDDDVIQITSLDLLQTMAHPQLKLPNGTIQDLVKIINPKASVSSKAREMALEVIMNACSDSLDMLMDCGFMDHILYFLRSGDVPIQEFAIKASSWLCETSDEAKKLMGDFGFMPILVKLIDSKSYVIREMGTQTLSNMVMLPRNRRKLVQDEENVRFLIELLDGVEVDLGVKKALICLLNSLAYNNSAKKQMVNLGFLKKIEKLDHDQVSDAKKIIKKLSSKGFRYIFTWSWNA